MGDRGSRLNLLVVGLLCAAGFLAGTSAASGQPVRVGATSYPKPSDGGTRRFPSVAYDGANNAYLVVWGIGGVGARFVNSDGSPIGSPVNLNVTTGGPPDVACAAEINVCLVTWIQEPYSIIGRLVRYNAGAVQGVTSPFVVNNNGKYKLTSAAPDVAYSPVANEFLVAWTEFPSSGSPNVWAQRVSSTGANVGTAFAVAATTSWEGMTSLAYNSQQDEYAVGYYFEPGGKPAMAVQRVKPGTGALIGTRSTIYTSSADLYPELAYNSQTNQYLVISSGYTSPWMLHGWRADGNAQPLTSAGISLASRGGGDGIGLAYNPVSNTFFGVFQSQKNAEVWGVEISASGVPGPQAQISYSGTTLSVQPTAAGNTTDERFLMTASAAFTKVMAQLVTHGSMTTTTTTTCTTPQPGAGYTCVNGVWVAPTTSSSCTTVKPGPDWVCVNGNWLPPGSTTTTTTCTTPKPGTGYTCVNGVWVAPPPPSTSCTTVKPGPDWVCVNGNWLPPGSTTTTTTCTTPKPGDGWTCVNGNWIPPSTTSGSCTTVKPGPNWVCVNGNWLPPDTTTTTTTSCTTVKPGDGWTCVNGNWIPPSTTTTTTSTCTTVKPGDGWTCVNGNWFPPGY